LTDRFLVSWVLNLHDQLRATLWEHIGVYLPWALTGDADPESELTTLGKDGPHDTETASLPIWCEPVTLLHDREYGVV
jgi:hypothetical protein